MLTRAQVRELDRRAIEEYGVPGIVLMENASRGAAEVLWNLGIGGPVLICCGKGNNGGDGLAMARHLDNRGAAVRVLLFARPDEVAGDAGINLGIVQRSKHPLRIQPGAEELEKELADAVWVVDALFGTGLNAPIRAPLDSVVAAVNSSRKLVLA